MPGQKQLEREDFVLAGSSREWSVMVEIAVWWEPDVITIYHQESGDQCTHVLASLCPFYLVQNSLSEWSDPQLVSLLT